MLQSALQDAQGEISLLRHHIRVFASILEVLVLMSKQGKPLRVVDEDGSIFVPRLEMEQRKALGGSVSVDRHPGGHIVRFRERTVVPIGDVLYG